MPSDDPYRLPRHVLPHRYDLELVVDPERPGFSGRVRIEVEVIETTDRITLNSLDLDLTGVAVTGSDGTHREPTAVSDPETERVELLLDDALSSGAASIEIDFVGPFCESLVGLYRSSFTVDGQERHLAVTQFESTHARRAFPCFDEPDMKAVFAVSLVVPDHLLAASNASEVDRTALGDGTVRVTFADTMVMSTYLVALVVGPLEVTDTRMIGGRDRPIPLRVIHPAGSDGLTPFALEVADAGIRFLEDYYDIAYPGDKIDLVAVPDFAFGAMENLGLITFREIALLVDPDEATQPELQRVADVINHELAHMWFGDLVTMRWWEGIWLNEAFATFMEVAASDAFRPEWDTWTGFGLARAAAFDTDALASTRPIEFPVHSPADAEAMFDVLTYEKGASVLRMLERYLGAERFRDGIRHYLRTHAYGNTATTDLWDALEEVTGEPVRRIMDAWILSGGHPVVTARLVDDGIELDQTAAARSGDPSLGERWPVPLVVTATVDGSTRHERVLLEGPTVVDLGGAPIELRLNTGGDGFFRSELPASLRTADAVDPDSTPLERFVLVDDTWAALLRGTLTAAEVEQLLRLVAWRETDPSVWRRIAQAVRELRRLEGWDGAVRAPRLAQDVAALPRSRATEVISGVDESGRERWRDLRGILTVVLGVAGNDGDIRDLARDIVHTDPERLRERRDVDPALGAAALDVVAATGDRADHDLIEQRWRTAANPQDTIRHLYALADTPVPECFEKTLDLALGEVRAQDSGYLLRRALANPRHAGLAVEFVSRRWDDVQAKVPSSALVRMLEGVRTITDADLAADVVAFAEAHPLPSGSRVLAQHLERMAVNVAAAQRLRAG